MNAYDHNHKCWRCQRTLEYVYTMDNVDEYYCIACNMEQKRSLELVDAETRLTETYGE